jgi:hypothetical protein
VAPRQQVCATHSPQPLTQQVIPKPSTLHYTSNPKARTLHSTLQTLPPALGAPTPYPSRSCPRPPHSAAEGNRLGVGRRGESTLKGYMVRRDTCRPTPAGPNSQTALLFRPWFVTRAHVRAFLAGVPATQQQRPAGTSTTTTIGCASSSLQPGGGTLRPPLRVLNAWPRPCMSPAASGKQLSAQSATVSAKGPVLAGCALFPASSPQVNPKP